MRTQRFVLASGAYLGVSLDVVITSEGHELREVRVTTAEHGGAHQGTAILKPEEARRVATAIMSAADAAERKGAR